MADEAGGLRAGVFGGTFDPIHVGHLILMEEARYELGLDVVYLMPAADPPHKQGNPMSPVADRIRMCELATADADHLRISRIDADRPGPHYSADMVPLLQKSLGEKAHIFFLMGMDSLRDLPAWHEPQRLLAQCTPVALSRAGVEIEWTALETALPGIREQVILLDMPLLEISGTDLRARVRAGRPIRYQTPRIVEEYVYAHGLYRKA
jgi:nicotinate-nucleotide adenylyltransferase